MRACNHAFVKERLKLSVFCYQTDLFLLPVRCTANTAKAFNVASGTGTVVIGLAARYYQLDYI